jgi:hypothetical protein
MTHDHGKSDRLVVPQKSSNKAGRPATETTEGSERAKGNSPEGHDDRTQRRVNASAGIERVRQAVRRERKQQFTALLHHVYDLERVRTAYLALKRDAAAGIDCETWRHYGETWEDNLRDLSARINCIRLSGVHLPTETRKESLGEILRQPPPGDERQGRQAGPAHYP